MDKNKSWYNSYSQTEVNLIKRAYLELADSDFSEADSFAEKILNINVENEEAWWIKLLAKHKLKSDNDIFKLSEDDFHHFYIDDLLTKVFKFAKKTSFAYYDDLITEKEKQEEESEKRLDDFNVEYKKYLKEELLKVGIGDRIARHSHKKFKRMKPSTIILHLIIYSFISILSIYFMATTILKYYYFDLSNVDDADYFYYFSLMGFVPLAVSFLTYKTLVFIFGKFLTEDIYMGSSFSSLLTPVEYIKNPDKRVYSNTLEELYLIQYYIKENYGIYDFFNT